MPRITKLVLAIAAVPVLTGALCLGRTPPGNEPQVNGIDFAPIDGTWDIRWVNRPGGILFSDTERYRVTLTGVSSPGAQSRNLQIMAGSTIIGIMRVDFPGGTGAPTFRYNANEGARVTPSGAVDLTNGEFWLGCTSPNRHVRGNRDHGTGTQSNVSVRLAWEHGTSSPARTIRCLP